MSIETKTFTGVEIKDAAKGTVRAVFATLGVIDKDGDVVMKGAIPDGAEVVISAYSHTSWKGSLPVGKGTIHEVGDEAILDGEFFMKTTHGVDTFETVKGLGGLGEWSFSLQNVKASRGEIDGKTARLLSSIEVKEVSPVLVGAGVDTRTLEVKSADQKQLTSTIARMLAEAGDDRWADGWSYVYLDDFDLDDNTAVFVVVDYSGDRRVRTRWQVTFERTETSVTLGDEATEVEFTTIYLPKGSKFSEHKDVALRGVKSLVEMAVERLTLRAAEGKSTEEQRDALGLLEAELAPLRKALDDATQPPTDGLDLRTELELIAIKNGVLT